jgi:hypothetical protein
MNRQSFFVGILAIAAVGCKTADSNKYASSELESAQKGTAQEQAARSVALQFIREVEEQLEQSITTDERYKEPSMAGRVEWARNQVKRMKKSTVISRAILSLSFNGSYYYGSGFKDYGHKILENAVYLGFGFNKDLDLSGDNATVLAIEMFANVIDNPNRLSEGTKLGQSLIALNAASQSNARLAKDLGVLADTILFKTNEELAKYNTGGDARLDAQKQKALEMLTEIKNLGKMTFGADEGFNYAMSHDYTSSNFKDDLVAQITEKGFAADFEEMTLLASSWYNATQTNSVKDAAGQVVNDLQQ